MWRQHKPGGVKTAGSRACIVDIVEVKTGSNASVGQLVRRTGTLEREGKVGLPVTVPEEGRLTDPEHKVWWNAREYGLAANSTGQH